MTVVLAGDDNAWNMLFVVDNGHAIDIKTTTILCWAVEELPLRKNDYTYPSKQSNKVSYPLPKQANWAKYRTNFNSKEELLIQYEYKFHYQE